MAQPTTTYLLKWSQKITPNVMHLAFEREDAAPLTFKAGQFITFQIASPQDPAKILHRSYSIANIPGKSNVIEIACSYVEGGVASQILFNMKPGDSIQASGPHGLFVLKEEMPARYVLIATGTGVTPYRSMLDELQTRFQSQSNLKAVVILGVREKKDLLFGEDFIQFANQQPNFTFSACYSRENNTTLQPFERKGHVQDLFPELALDPAQDLIYLCGNPFMIDQSFATLTALGFDKKSIRREKYLFAH